MPEPAMEFAVMKLSHVNPGFPADRLKCLSFQWISRIRGWILRFSVEGQLQALAFLFF